MEPVTDYGKILQENLRDIMKQRGVTQAWMAVQAQTTEATISRYLTGVHSPKIELVAKMASALHVSVDYLLGLSSSTVPDKPPTPEVRSIIAAYNRADAHTKKMVWMQLETVMSDEEKASAPKRFDEPKQESEAV